MSLKFSMILEAVDKATGPARRVQQSMRGLTSGMRAWGEQVRKVSDSVQSGARSLQFYETRARRLRQLALGRFFQAASMEARRFSESLRSGIRNLNLMERAGKALGGGVRSLGSGALGLAQWGIAGAGAAAGLAVYDLFRTAGQFEQFNIMLEQQSASAAKARESMAWITKFATDTPYELENVTRAFLTIKNAGLDPMKGALRAAGDAAAGSSADIEQAADAIKDAVTGEFERLKELGITTSRSGDQVRLTWMKNEKEFSKTAKATDKLGIAMAVVAAWSDKFGGSTEKQSKSLFGVISNLKDKWSEFLRMVADAGIFNKVKTALVGFLDRLNKMTDNGQLREWAQSISDGMSAAFDWGVKFVQGVDWPAVGRGLATGVQAMLKLVELFGKAVDTYMRFQAYRAARLYETKEGSWFASDKDKASARAARQRIEAQYGPLTTSGENEKAASDKARGEWRGKFWRRSFGGPNIPIGQGFNRLPSGGARPNGAAATRVQVGGTTKVEISLKGGIQGRVIENKSDNRDLLQIVQLGKTMAWPG